MEPIHYKYFHTALKSESDRQDKAQKVLAVDSGISESYISNVFKKKKLASMGVQEKLSEALGFSLIDFLILGRNIVERKSLFLTESPPVYISECAPKLLPGSPDTERRHRQTDSREGILDLFEDKERARKIILDLWEIEQKDPAKLNGIGMFLKGVLLDMPSKKTAREA